MLFRSATPSPPSNSQPLPHSTLSRTPPEGWVLRSEAAAARSSSLRPAAPEVGDDTATPCCSLPCSSLALTCLTITTALTRDVFPSVSCPGAPVGSRRSWSTAAEKKEIVADARSFPIKLHSPPKLPHDLRRRTPSSPPSLDPPRYPHWPPSPSLELRRRHV